MLGLEWDEERQESGEFGLFVYEYVGGYKLKNKCGKLEVVLYVSPEKWEPTGWLGSILTGEKEIIKKPWKPKHGEEYYYPAIITTEGISLTHWENDIVDRHRFEHNLIYKTKEEAIARAKEILELIKSSNSQLKIK
jgi:hypothetical protein